jgi:hypothetical protein
VGLIVIMAPIILNADNMPVNMVSHAHGQGVCRQPFIIPRTIAGIHFKGSYDAEGRFLYVSYVDFHTLNSLPYNTMKMEGGCLILFDYWACLHAG